MFGAQFFVNRYLDHTESRYEISFGYVQEWECCGWLKNFEIGGLMFLKLSRYFQLFDFPLVFLGTSQANFGRMVRRVK